MGDLAKSPLWVTHFAPTECQNRADSSGGESHLVWNLLRSCTAFDGCIRIMLHAVALDIHWIESMPETRLIRDDAYEEMAATYQCIQIDELNNALKDNGIEDVAVRRKICERFLFAMGNFHDQYWFETEGKRVHPLLCFSSQFLNVDSDVNAIGDVYTPSELFAFHEYAFGNNVYYFEEHNEDVSDINMGPVGG